jgi:hypothetical protein
VHPIPAVIDQGLPALQRRAARAYVTDVITNIVNGHPNSRIDELLPWVYPGTRSGHTRHARAQGLSLKIP